MYYTVYKTTNSVNGKAYIGVHKTEDLDDGYLGSGKVLKRAIAKHGREAFVKEIIAVFDSAEQMFELEAELVCEESLPGLYNIKCGGHGGFDFINATGRNIYEGHRETVTRVLDEHRARAKAAHAEMLKDPEYRARYAAKCSKVHIGNTYWVGRKHRDDSKRKMSDYAKTRTGEKHSQFGSCWVTNGTENKKIKRSELEEFLSSHAGWRAGRVCKS